MELINAINEWAAAIGMRRVFGDQYYFDFMRDKNGAVSPEAQRLRDQLAEEADLLQRLTNPIRAYPQAFPLLIKYYLNAE